MLRSRCFLLGVVTLACGRPEPAPDVSAPASAAAGRPAAAPAEPPLDAGGGDCVIERLVDGDSFHCRDGREVRLIGLDAPELAQRPYGRASRDALARLLPAGAAVRLEADVEPRDRYGRMLAYAWRADTFVNERMIAGGWALAYTRPPNVRHVDRLRRAQREAEAARAGLWRTPAFRCTPADHRARRC